MRKMELVLLNDGGVELLEVLDDDAVQVWASDSDEDFIEEFPDLLDENDVEHVFDYLVLAEWLTEEEADECEVSSEAGGPGDDDDDDDEDDGEDFIEGELLHA
jgi:hypothetical protein